MPQPSNHQIWPRAPLVHLLIVLPLHRNTLVSHLFQFPFPFQIIGCYLFGAGIQSIQDGGSIYIDFRKFNATIRKDHYPLPLIDPMHGSFEEHVMEDVPFHVVSPNEA
ncbi:hypothetical protein TB2_027345 [Malus domestica]